MRRLINRSISFLAYLPEQLRRYEDKPLPTSFYYRAFYANRRTANAVAATKYLQSMHRGTLSPLDYGCLTVQDAYYCYRALDTLYTIRDRIDQTAQPEFHSLVETRICGLADYNQTFLEDWHILNTESVIPTETMRLYAEHEQRVAHEEDPIYTFVAQMPCYHLWPWFARQLMMSPLYRPGVYRSWFESVYEGENESFSPGWTMGSFIEEWKKRGNPFDEDLAHDIYRTSMDFELKVFSEACSD